MKKGRIEEEKGGTEDRKEGKVGINMEEKRETKVGIYTEGQKYTRQVDNGGGKGGWVGR